MGGGGHSFSITNQKGRLLSAGVVTTGSAQRYIESYAVYFSKDRKSWKLHKDVQSKEKKVGVPAAPGGEASPCGKC